MKNLLKRLWPLFVSSRKHFDLQTRADSLERQLKTSRENEREAETRGRIKGAFEMANNTSFIDAIDSTAKRALRAEIKAAYETVASLEQENTNLRNTISNMKDSANEQS